MFRRIVRDIASTAAYCEPQVYRRKNRRKEAQPNHPISLLLCEPTEEMSAYDLFRTSYTRYLLDSTAYLEVRFNFDDKPAGLELPKEHSVIPKRDQDGLLYYYDRTSGKDLAPDEICHFRGINIDGFSGIPLMEDNIELELAQSSLEHAADYFKNGANMDGFFSSTMGLNDDERFRIQQIIDSSTGPGNAHKALMLGADVQWNPMSNDPDKSQLFQSRQASIEDVARMLSYPLKKLSGDTTEDVRNEFVECVRLHLEVFEREYSFKLLSLEERRQGYFIEHDLSSLKRSQTTAKIDDYAKVFGFGVVTPNEIREALNLEPSDDPNADIPYVAVNNLAAVGSEAGKEALEPLDEAVTPQEVETPVVHSEAVKAVFSEALGRVYRRSRKALGKATPENRETILQAERTFALEALKSYAALVNLEVEPLVSQVLESDKEVEQLVDMMLGGTNG